MRWYRRLGALFVCGLLAVSAAGPSAMAQTQSALQTIQQRGTVKVGWAVWFPYAYRDPKTNELAGASIDLIENLGKELGVKVEWVEDSVATLVAGLQSNKFDMTFPLTITMPRALAVTFSKPFLESGVGLMVRKDDLAKYESWQDLDKPGLKITTTLGSNVDVFATKAFHEAELLRVKDAPASLTQVLTGRAHAWANTYDAFEKIKAERPDLAVVPGQPFGFSRTAFVVRQGDYVFRDWLNYFIEDQVQSGTLAKILAKHNLDQSFLID